jgi:hypothetical protein
VEQSLVVVAHLSEGIPRDWLLDSVALEQFLDNEMTFGLQLAVEAKALTDINATATATSRRCGGSRAASSASSARDSCRCRP